MNIRFFFFKAGIDVYKRQQKAHRSTDWERMGGYTADAKSKNYLEDEDLA